jgi:hypothetical protein
LRTVDPNYQFAEGPESSRHLLHLAAERAMLVQCEWIHQREFNTRRLLQF